MNTVMTLLVETAMDTTTVEEAPERRRGSAIIVMVCDITACSSVCTMLCTLPALYPVHTAYSTQRDSSEPCREATVCRLPPKLP
jgi:hypothetical protein